MKRRDPGNYIRWRRNNRERLREHAAKTRARPENKRRMADDHRWRVYKLSSEAYDALAIEAQGRCQVCGERAESAGDHELVVDHDHVTGAVRGLVCNECNVSLGWLERWVLNPEWRRRVKTYLMGGRP